MTQPRRITHTAYRDEQSERWYGQITVELPDGPILLIDSESYTFEVGARGWGEQTQESFRRAARIRVLVTHGAEEMNALRSRARKEEQAK